MRLVLDQRAHPGVFIDGAVVIDVKYVRQVGFGVQLVGLVPVWCSPPMVKALTIERCLA